MNNKKIKLNIWLFCSRATVCAVVLIIALVIKFFGGQTYLNIKSEYEKLIYTDTSVQEVFNAQKDKNKDAVHNASFVKTESDKLSADDADETIDFKKVATMASVNKYMGKMTMPCKYIRISSEFGYRVNPVTNNYAMHSGIDMSADSGTDIHAALEGEVTCAEYNYDYGYHVIIKHGDELGTLYAHCSKLLVKKGDKVDKGELIAKVGSTGQSTGPHLHFEVRVNGVRINPVYFLPEQYEI